MQSSNSLALFLWVLNTASRVSTRIEEMCYVCVCNCRLSTCLITSIVLIYCSHEYAITGEMQSLQRFSSKDRLERYMHFYKTNPSKSPKPHHLWWKAYPSSLPYLSSIHFQLKRVSQVHQQCSRGRWMRAQTPRQNLKALAWGNWPQGHHRRFEPPWPFAEPTMKDHHLKELEKQWEE